MPGLIVRFHDSALHDFNWFVDRSDSPGQSVEWQPGSEGDLVDLAKSHTSVILVIPQQDVYLTSYELPGKASRQVLSSIEYQIEDQLAQDVEIQHFAPGDPSSNPIAIAVVEKVIMLRCINLIQKHDLQVTQIIPEVFLCPRPAKVGEVNLIESHEGVILRYGDFQAIKCHPDLTEVMLKLIAAEQKIEEVNYCLQNSEVYEVVKVDNFPANLKQLTLPALDSVNSASINLMQREFEITSIWSKLLVTWKWVLGLILILIVVGSYNRAIALQQMETRLSDIKSVQYELLKNHLPPNLDKSDDLKRALINLLKQSQSGVDEVNFLELLRQFTQAKTAYATVTVGKISYQNKRLSIDVTSNQLSDIESLLEAIEASGQVAKLESLNIKPDIISGQFVLFGESE